MSSKLGVENIAHTNGTNAMTISSGGVTTFTNQIVTPTRPSFYAANLDGATFNSGTLTGADNSSYGYTNGSMSYNSSTGELTVPISGLYMISFGILVQPNSGRCEANISHQPNGGSYGLIFYADANGTSTYDMCGGSLTFILNANDKLKVTRSTGTAYAFAHPAHFINVAYIGA